jgi:hypothetical protein
VCHRRLRDGSEELRSTDVLQQLERGDQVSRRSLDGQGAALPADLTAGLDLHPAPESAIWGEADAEALAPWVRHMPHPFSQAPALALSCREADTLGEANRAPTHRIRSVSAGRAGCSHLPRPDQIGELHRSDSTGDGW